MTMAAAVVVTMEEEEPAVTQLAEADQVMHQDLLRVIHQVLILDRDTWLLHL